MPSTFPEDLDKGLGPEDYVVRTAARKNSEVFNRLLQRGEKKGGRLVVLSADTVVVGPHGEILEKPGSREHARAMLLSLGSSSHSVFTGVTLAVEGLEPVSFYEETVVKFTDLTLEAVEAYLDTGEYVGKAGGYGIQGLAGAVLVSGVEGCYYNVVGLPLFSTCRVLTDLVKNFCT